MREEVATLVRKGAVEVVTSPSPGFYGRFFCVPKASGGWRPVLDLSALNRFLLEVPFKMETAASIREAVRPGDWGASLDLTDAYFHVPIAKADRKWLRFVWEGQVFQSVQGPPFRPLTGPMGVHHDSQGIGQGAPVHGYSHQDVPGRLASTSGLAGAVRRHI